MTTCRRLLFFLIVASTNVLLIKGASKVDPTEQCKPQALKRPTLCYKTEDDGESYRGTIEQTVGGKRCTSWNNLLGMIDIAALPTHRYCRNFGGLLEGEAPWCYYNSLLRDWDYCAIPTCETLCMHTQDGKWSPFSKWSECSKPCGKGGGVQERVRVCLDGKTCKGKEKEQKSCNTKPCDPSKAPGQWTRWANMTNCSVSCGEGTIIQRRSCVTSVKDRGAQPSHNCVGNASRPVDCTNNDCALPWYVWFCIGLGCALFATGIAGFIWYQRKRQQMLKAQAEAARLAAERAARYAEGKRQSMPSMPSGKASTLRSESISESEGELEDESISDISSDYSADSSGVAGETASERMRRKRAEAFKPKYYKETNQPNENQ